MALKQFEKDNGKYPESLQDLTPRYLQTISPPAWGLGRWIYTVNPDGFDLRVNETIYTGDGDSMYLRYDERESKWVTGD